MAIRSRAPVLIRPALPTDFIIDNVQSSNKRPDCHLQTVIEVVEKPSAWREPREHETFDEHQQLARAAHSTGCFIAPRLPVERLGNMASRSERLTQPPTDLYYREKTVGSGSFGTVYQGRCKITKDVVAIKVINLETSEDEIEDLMGEVSILTDVQAKHCVQFYGAYVRKAEIWIVMELCGGGSVQDLIKCFNIPETDCATITKGTMQGLQWLHENRMIHRDIKAANILLTEDGVVKLADFGVAGRLQIEHSLKNNTFVGTPYWMAPEVLTESGYDDRADVWSTGITCIELVNGEPPLSDIHPMKVLLLIPRNPPPSLSGDFSEHMKDFVAMCLTKTSNKRPKVVQMLAHPWLRKAGKNVKHLLDRKYKYYQAHPSEAPPEHKSFDSMADFPRDSQGAAQSDAGHDDDSWDFGTVKLAGRGTVRPGQTHNGARAAALEVMDAAGANSRATASSHTQGSSFADSLTRSMQMLDMDENQSSTRSKTLRARPTAWSEEEHQPSPARNRQDGIRADLPTPDRSSPIQSDFRDGVNRQTNTRTSRTSSGSASLPLSAALAPPGQRVAQLLAHTPPNQIPLPPSPSKGVTGQQQHSPHLDSHSMDAMMQEHIAESASTSATPIKPSASKIMSPAAASAKPGANGARRVSNTRTAAPWNSGLASQNQPKRSAAPVTSPSTRRTNSQQPPSTATTPQKSRPLTSSLADAHDTSNRTSTASSPSRPTSAVRTTGPKVELPPGQYALPAPNNFTFDPFATSSPATPGALQSPTTPPPAISAQAYPMSSIRGRSHHAEPISAFSHVLKPALRAAVARRAQGAQYAQQQLNDTLGARDPKLAREQARGLQEQQDRVAKTCHKIVKALEEMENIDRQRPVMLGDGTDGFLEALVEEVCKRVDAV